MPVRRRIDVHGSGLDTRLPAEPDGRLIALEGRRHWVVGPVQEWWLEYEKVSGRYLLGTVERQLLDQLSSCGVPSDVPSNRKSATR